MYLDRPSIRRVHTEPPATAGPVDDSESAWWFTPSRSAPVVPDPLPHDLALLGWGRITLVLVLEVLARRRRIEQVETRLDAQAARYLRAHLNRTDTTSAPHAQLLSLRLSQPHADAGELAGVYRTGRRVHALAARAERPAGTRGPWVLTALRLLTATPAVAPRRHTAHRPTRPGHPAAEVPDEITSTAPAAAGVV